MSVDLEQLQANLSEHKEQLTQIEALLKLNPEDETLIKLHADLRQVVALTEDLTKMQGIQTYGQEEEKKWKEEDRCMALWEDGQYYVARIDSVDDLAGYTVTYLDYGQQAVVPEESLAPYQPAPLEALTAGTPVKALWKDLYYPAIVHGPGDAPGLLKVKFSKWKKKKDIPAYDIMLRDGDTALIATLSAEPSAAAASGDGSTALVPAAAAAAATSTIIKRQPLPDKLVIPESLLPKATDSEKQRQAKQKKIKRLKSQFALKKKEQEGEAKQAAWQRFSRGHGLGKRSIFASPDSVEGKVGVTGSGKGMTHFEDRKKWFGLKAAPPQLPSAVSAGAAPGAAAAAAPPPLPLATLGFSSAPPPPFRG